jgi:C-22 sterol desaturase
MMESERYCERIAAGEAKAEKPTNLIREFTDEEIRETLFTFLFASQDASSSATTWLFQVFAQTSDVLDRLREENLAARGGDRHKLFDLPMLESLTYTNAVIKELLRHRPPVIFVPYLATKNFPVTPKYTVPKGSMVIPSCYPALHDPYAYPKPNVLYVPLSMSGMISKAALELDWDHHATERSEEISVFATLFPMVSTYY